MQRRHFLNKAALWGGGLVLATAWVPRFRATDTAIFGDKITRFSPPQQDFLREFCQQVQSHLAEYRQPDKLVRAMLRPVEVLRQDAKQEVLAYRNAARQIVIVDKQQDEFRIRFLDYLPSDVM